MTKRKVQFAEQTDEMEYESSAKSRRFKENHSLDSDDEEEGKEKTKTVEDENVLHEDDIEGQEEETIRNDEGISVTPFNLKDELEEGHFDAEGNYIANERSEDINDEWLDSVNWKEIKDDGDVKYNKKKQENIDTFVPSDPIKIKQQMVAIMKPGENVLKALRRLGGNKKPISSADRWKKKKNKQAEEPEDEKTKQNKENLLKLTGYADELLQNGEFQIYEKTFEKLEYEIKNKMAQFADADDSEDDELEAAFKESKGQESKVQNMEEDQEDKNNVKDSDIIDVNTEVQWVYKLEDKEESELLGPFSNSQMMKWQESGHFKNGVYCRKADSQGSFYHSKRMDFELYT